ncbi:hypothetical protein AMTRI_Chr12g241330 [Amborella trichopoda]
MARAPPPPFYLPYLPPTITINTSRPSYSYQNYSPQKSGSDPTAGIVATISILVFFLKLGCVFYCCCRRRCSDGNNAISDSQFKPGKIDKFLGDMEKLKPIRFSPQQLSSCTGNYSHLLGAGGFGTVYKGTFPNGVNVAVKVLRGTSVQCIEAQFMAEVSTIGRTHHVNLVRLIGFCFDICMSALVYEYMEKGSLDGFLFGNKEKLGFEKLREIAVGTAKAIAYLHEECQQMIIHYDIKPGNILLDRNFSPKVADFGLAKLCNRDATHVTMTGGRGTPGYAAPELWMPFPITQKCDVYSYGMLLFEIVGRRRNLQASLSESQHWFPRWVWEKFEKGELEEMMIKCVIEEENRGKTERMIMVALWCVQYRPELRPCMSSVVRMLEEGVEIISPPNPFAHLVAGLPAVDMQQFRYTTEETYTESYTGATTAPMTTPTMRRFEISIAST